MVILVGAWALALYIHILRLPFFRDDMVMLLWLRGMPWGRLWVDATGFPYYRPLSFSTLKLSELFFGYYQPQFLHLVNLFFHTANSVMLALLTRLVVNGRRGALAGLFAGLLYAAYPFTFEVMPTTGPIFQLQAAFFALAAALAYARWRCNTQYPIPNTSSAFGIRYLTFGPNGWLYLSLFMALLGSFTCEYSVIIPPLIIATELVLWRQSCKQRETSGNAQHATRFASPCRRPKRSLGVTLSLRLAIPLLYFVFTALYLAIWLAVPKTRSTLPWLWLHDLGHKTVYYLQGLTYPLQPAAPPLARLLKLEPLTDGAALSGEWAWPAVLLLAAIALVGLLIVFARCKRLDVLALGLAWWGLALAPMWPTLNWDYTWNGPRLHYIPALGAALIWGSAIALLAKSAEDAKKEDSAALVKLSLGVAVFLAALVPGASFLRAQADVVLTGGKIADDVVRAVNALPPDKSALVVNFPSWISPARQTYAIGAEGITFLPGYSTLAELVEINSPALPRQRSVTSLTFTNVWKPWKHTQRFYTPPLSWEDLLPALRTASRVFQVQYAQTGLELDQAGAIQPSALSTTLATFDGRVNLARVAYLHTTQRLAITLDWVSLQPAEADWTVFLHVYDEGGKLVAQGDGDPMLGLYPLWAWQRDERIQDERYITLPPDLPPGHYRVGAGVYDRNTGTRITASGPDGQQFADDVVTLFEFDH